MNVLGVLLAPVRIPLRVVRALDDLATLADRARRDPDPVEEVRTRLDALLAELDELNALAREAVDGGRTVARAADLRYPEIVALAHSLVRTGQDVHVVGRDIHAGGQDLTATGQALERDTRELIDGGERLREVTEQLEAHLRLFRAAMPRVMEGLDTVEELEGAVETVAETVEPLQGAAERVGRVTRRLSRRSD